MEISVNYLEVFLLRYAYVAINFPLRIAFPASREICVQVKKQQLELDVEQGTGSKLGKE